MHAVVGLGANLGDRLAALRAALEGLARVATVEKVSSVYATAPVGGPPQPDYLNAAVLVETELRPRELLHALLAIESTLGRVRRERNGPRVIDLDVLWIEGVVVKSEELEVPHPRLAERAFALVPMLEVAPGARDPRTGVAYVAPEGEVRIVPEMSLLR
ncbi:MAG: 2-amino-4-hydroxy-6-hydroxymethyldihydropteridine diphosphokinase [Polyangiaceae bacterium]